MRFLADENIQRSMISALEKHGHDVESIRHDARGASDEQVLSRAVASQRVLLTADKDFGEPAFRRRLPAPSGIILLRLRGSADQRVATLIAAINERNDWAGHFSVVEFDRIRMTPLNA